jgi:hypothetical protein
MFLLVVLSLENKFGDSLHPNAHADAFNKMLNTGNINVLSRKKNTYIILVVKSQRHSPFWRRSFIIIQTYLTMLYPVAIIFRYVLQDYTVLL